MAETRVAYKCDQVYAPASEGGLLWSDPALNIEWPLPKSVLISEKDIQLPTLTSLDSPFEAAL